jgi:type IV pilus assembly protein PilN
MIRVNLLATTPGAAVKAQVVPKEQRVATLGLTALLVTATAVGGWWWDVHRERLATEATIATDEAEVVHLKDVAKLVDRASARKAELAERLSLIDRLKATKRGPVTLLETVSGSLSDGLWLTELKQTALVVQIEGRATSLTAITDFAEKLQDSTVFERPVEIVTTTAETLEDTPVVRFVVKATLVDHSKPASTAAAVPAAAPAKGM